MTYRAWATRVALVLSPLLFHTPVAAQEPVLELPPVELDSTAIGIIVGGSAGVTLGRSEAFDRTKPGPGLQLFVGSSIPPLDEARIGVTIHRLSDTVKRPFEDPETAPPPPPVIVRGVYLELYLARDTRWSTIRFGPRLSWLHVSGSPIRRLHDFAVGGVVGPEFRVGERMTLETILAATQTIFPRPQGSSDPDRIAPGTLWELRAGLAYLLR